MNILIAHDVPREHVGGMSYMMKRIHRPITAKGDRVSFFCAEDAPKVTPSFLRRFLFPWFLYKYCRDAFKRGERYDLINVHEPSGVWVALLKRYIGKPKIIIMSYGVELRYWAIENESAKAKRLSVSLKSRITYPLTSLWQSYVGLRFADYIFCSNTEDRAFLVNKLRIPERKIMVLQSGANLLYKEIAKDRSYEDIKRIIFAGTWVERKGIVYLRDAFVRLAQRYPGISLVIFGGGIGQEKILSSFPEELRNRIECLSSSDERIIAKIYASCDMYILPSLFEGCPLTLTEAMMSGMSIITTDICGMKDKITSGVNGILIPPYSSEAIVTAVEALMWDAASRERLGKQA